MIKLILLIAVVIFFALNMGASGIAPAFAAVYGGKLIKKQKAVILFGIFVILGALCLGQNVALTLGKSLLPQRLISFDSTLIILISAAVSLFLANFLKIPQSTRQVTVAAIVGVGLYFRQLYVKILLFKILPVWLILPLLSYLLTFLFYRIIYPPRHHNLHFYQKIFTHAKRIRLSALIVSSYVAFAIGTNNVANAVGPLFGAGIISITFGLFLVAPLFSIGGWLMGKGNLETAGNEIVPLGLISSTIVSLVLS